MGVRGMEGVRCGPLPNGLHTGGRYCGRGAIGFDWEYQLEACKWCQAWSRYGSRLTHAWLEEPEAEQRFGNMLRAWAGAFRRIEEESARYLKDAAAGLYNPVGMAHMLGRAQELFGDFARFAEEHPLLTGREPRPMEGEMRSVPIGQHKLPPLPYAYNALEPHIDEQTMRLHHQKHHQSYVDGLNKAERMMAQARQTGDFDLIRHWEREAAFNGAGHYLHTIFWNVMKPGGGGEPAGALADQIRKDFGSFDAFKQHFTNAADKVEAVGWALLVWAPRARRLEILQAEKHQNLSQWDVVPLLVLDVWEHAYYLKYQNDRKAYINAWWNVVNWDHVAERFARAQQLRWEPY